MTDSITPTVASTEASLKVEEVAVEEEVKAVRIEARPDSPDPNCAICLGPLENKSFTDSCCHTFCFTCLQEWSKVRPECPLCKQRFNSIIHNVRSIEDYDQYDLTSQYDLDSDSEIALAQLNRLTTSRITVNLLTLTIEQRRQIALEQLTRLTTRIASRRNRARRPVTTTSEFRDEIYRNSVWVVPLQSVRYRETSAEFYRDNPDCIHRLFPWLDRELNVLLNNHVSNVVFLLELIISLIQRFNIQSEEFREHISPFLMNRTAHFTHEFYNFACSIYEMRTYDQLATYPSNHRWSHHEVIDISPDAETPRRVDEVRTRPDETITIGSDRSGASSTNSNSNQSGSKVVPLVEKLSKFGYRRTGENSVSNARSSVRCSTKAPLPFDEPINDQPGPSGINAGPKVKTAFHWDSDDSSDEEHPDSKAHFSSFSDICVVETLKPKSQRTPELITLDSNSSDEYFSDTKRHVVDDKNLPKKNFIYSRSSESDDSDVATHKNSASCKYDSDSRSTYAHSEGGCRKRKRDDRVRKNAVKKYFFDSDESDSNVARQKRRSARLHSRKMRRRCKKECDTDSHVEGSVRKRRKSCKSKSKGHAKS
ncbi:TOPORS (predicted) [Pycnogonum litorale]